MTAIALLCTNSRSDLFNPIQYAAHRILTEQTKHMMISVYNDSGNIFFKDRGSIIAITVTIKHFNIT